MMYVCKVINRFDMPYPRVRIVDWQGTHQRPVWETEVRDASEETIQAAYQRGLRILASVPQVVPNRSALSQRRGGVH